MTGDKHAYLVIAHKCDDTFQTLLCMLDDVRNDIFIHMDAKNKNFNVNDIQKVKYSSIYFTERTKVTWGGYSQINSELLLLRLAIETGKYSYYHLISGEDLPIKSQDYIHHFFALYSGCEFIRFEKSKFDYFERVRYRYFFQEKIGRGGKNIVWGAVNRFSIYFQEMLHITRNQNICFQKGTNWFSITDNLARYVVSKSKWIGKTFKKTICCDEVFLQTIVENSIFKYRLFWPEYDNSPYSIMRLIDWKRGNPYVFRKEDFEDIKDSEMLWARKFDCQVDKKIISMIYNEITK